MAETVLKKEERKRMLVTLRGMSRTSFFPEVDGIAFGINFKSLAMSVLCKLTNVFYELEGS